MGKFPISSNQPNKKEISKFKTLTGKFKKILGLGALALSVAIGNNIFSKDSYTVGIVADRPDDTFVNTIPIYKSTDSNILVTVLNDGTLVITNDEIEKDKKSRIKVSCLNNKNEIITGYIPSEYIQNSVNIDSDFSLYRVNSENGVNLRHMPNTEFGKKISSLPNGTIVLGKSKNENWSRVIHITKNSLHDGYSASRFLSPLGTEHVKEVTPELDETPVANNEVKAPATNEIPKVKYNVQNGNVFGIDVYDFLPPKMFEKLLTGKLPIPKKIQTTRFPSVNLGKYPNRKPDFVYIKLAASGYGAKELKQGKPAPFKEMSEICEKLGVPYGFYYYSTCTNDQEAQMEANWISENMSKLEKTKYNLLPLVLDVEIAHDKDRQFRVSREQLTDSKIKLANLVEPKFGKTILYSAMNTLETILDIEQYQEGLKSGNSAVWLVSPSKRFLKFPQVMAEYEKVKEHVVAEQIVLDAFVIPPQRVIDYSSRLSNKNKDKKDDKKPTITGAKSPKLALATDKSKGKTDAKSKGKITQNAKVSGKDKSKSNDKGAIKDKSKDIKDANGKPADVPKVKKVRDYIVDINVFNAKMFEKCINGQYKNLSLEYATRNSSKIVAENEFER